MTLKTKTQLCAASLLCLAMLSTGTARAAVEVGNGADARLLIAAVEAGKVALLRTLVENGANVNAVSRGDGTALISAVRRGDAALVDALLGLGADVNLASPGDGSPLIAAAQSGDAGLAKKLLAAGARPNAVVAGDETALINAARQGDLALVKLLVEGGASVELGAVDPQRGGRLLTPLNQAGSTAVRRFLAAHGARN